jgi:DNA-binding MarR family transcriptional regulator
MKMPAHPKEHGPECNCAAIRQAARHVTQFYDEVLAPSGLRTTQFSILVRLRQHGPKAIHAFADELVMDRTTLGRNILPLERDGLIVTKPGAQDRRVKELHLTDAGTARVRSAIKLWAAAQSKFETAFGPERSSDLRALLRTLVAIDLGSQQAAAPARMG